MSVIVLLLVVPARPDQKKADRVDFLCRITTRSAYSFAAISSPGRRLKVVAVV